MVNTFEQELELRMLIWEQAVKTLNEFISKRINAEFGYDDNYDLVKQDIEQRIGVAANNVCILLYRKLSADILQGSILNRLAAG